MDHEPKGRNAPGHSARTRDPKRTTSERDEVSTMRWQKLVLSGSAAVGAVAAINAWTRRDVRPLENPIGGEEGWFRWRGHRVAYTRRGSGDPVLLIHSIHASAWSYEWRRNVDALARENTVYTIDLLGFGRSDRPAIRYSAALYMALIADFAAQVIETPSVLVATSLSAAYAIVLAARDPHRFRAVVAVGPTGISRLSTNSHVAGDVPRIAIGTPVVGTAIFNTLVARRSIELALRLTYHDDRFVTPELVDVYFATAHQPGAKNAPSAFIAQQLNLGVRDEVRRLTQPLLIAWGEHAVEVPMEDLHAFRALKPDAEVVIFSRSGSLPHDERAAEWNESVRSFLRRLRGVSDTAEYTAEYAVSEPAGEQPPEPPATSKSKARQRSR
jgi:pimeloyl-ACP methyl ester carboxylesterase